MTEVNYRQLNGMALAYVGDAVYEVFIREHLIELGYTVPTKLHHHATHFVSAKAQAVLIKLMEADAVLTDEETAMFKHGRNATTHHRAKNTDIVTYRISTGFEAIFGYLQLTHQMDRIDWLAHWCIDQVEAGRTEQTDAK
ncbi:Mini-ribonuclease 3 [Furfurilactobacillus siliginis]|uniref:Mini-ribonuclease 3 n=1 Tax=Furfurilactobacillus siliginis TaxID=348151 RepID=A0A0R2KY88_9LACO|nr:Mini-ribonuclease 3 [Furfurilactobacillus siliginis]KRN94240.1 hypothetical protein IV55_GL000591 [Furfurilactobacillus siliginis]GEK29362.1 mini-ribonuclease 3 [Furfurilactobacillus siliginis]